MRSFVRRLAVLSALSAIVLTGLVACDSDDDPNVDVQVRGEVNSYLPESFTIQAGESVTWGWTVNGHSVTSMGTLVTDCTPDGIFDSGVLNSGATFSHTFAAAGTYAYGCTVPGHCAGFESALVIVQ